MTVLIAMVGAVSGAMSAALLAFINRAVHNEASALIITAIVAISLLKIGTGLWSRWLVLQFGQDTILRMIVDLSHRILRAPFRQLETLGTHRVLTALTTDVQVLGAAILKFPEILINTAVIGGCFVYLAWLSPVGLAALTVCVVLGAGIYRFLHATAFKSITNAREERDRLMSALRSMTDGIKELKINTSRKDDFLAHEVEDTAKKMRGFNLAAAKRYMVVDAWSQGLFYLLIAGVLALFPLLNAGSPEILTGYVIASLYVMTPVWAVIRSIPTFANGQASLDKLEELGVTIRAEQTLAPEQQARSSLKETPRIRFSEVCFSYTDPASSDTAFTVGPLDFELEPGELVFIVGGNGSGKSTFVKLLCGLYVPDSGSVEIGGQKIDESTIDWYRQHFSVVFSDFYLFERILGVVPGRIENTVNEYLAALELDHKVSISEGRFSTTSLSQGQRRRLALLTALMEDRPVQIFDEWAADQDPAYKQVFYSQLLPNLRASGKSIVVVTHDDRYFHMGDRVLRLHEGRFEETVTGHDAPAAVVR